MQESTFTPILPINVKKIVNCFKIIVSLTSDTTFYCGY